MINNLLKIIKFKMARKIYTGPQKPYIKVIPIENKRNFPTKNKTTQSLIYSFKIKNLIPPSKKTKK